jgi:hypothetical protein
MEKQINNEYKKMLKKIKWRIYSKKKYFHDSCIDNFKNNQNYINSDLIRYKFNRKENYLTKLFFLIVFNFYILPLLIYSLWNLLFLKKEYILYMYIGYISMFISYFIIEYILSKTYITYLYKHKMKKFISYKKIYNGLGLDTTR